MPEAQENNIFGGANSFMEGGGKYIVSGVQILIWGMLLKDTGSSNTGKSSTSKALTADELKRIGTPANNSGIRQVKGTEIDAWNLFNNQVIKSTIKEVQTGVFVGQGTDGFTYTFRAISKSGPPTIDINGIVGLRKIKFIS